MSELLADPTHEAIRLTDAATDASVLLRVTGGVGVAMRCPSAAREPLSRTYADIDAFTRGPDRRAVTALLIELGYEAEVTFNSLHGNRRLFFWDATNNRQLDVCVDQFEMCHKLDLSHRLDTHPNTVPLADLLLMNCKSSNKPQGSHRHRDDAGRSPIQR